MNAFALKLKLRTRLLVQKKQCLFSREILHHKPNERKFDENTQKIEETTKEFEKFLFSHKGGGGLAALSGQLGNKQYPTLSLPTTGMNGFKPPEEINRENPTEEDKKAIEILNIAQSAIADLKRAIEEGYDIVLIIREKDGYFKNPLSLPPDFKIYQQQDGKFVSPGKKEYIPSFWGGIDTTINHPLANYYLTELNQLIKSQAPNLSKLNATEKTASNKNLSASILAIILYIPKKAASILIALLLYVKKVAVTTARQVGLFSKSTTENNQPSTQTPPSPEVPNNQH